MKTGYFITGTDTDAGKTLCSAALLKGNPNAYYYKPVQAGDLDKGGDCGAVLRLSGVSAERIISPAYALSAPLSPHAAAKIDKKEICLQTALKKAEGKSPLIVEGAGGVFVPLNKKEYIIDLIKLFKLPTIVVCRTGLGTINHTLLTLQALRGENIPIKGLVAYGPPDPSNFEALTYYGKTRLLAHIPQSEKQQNNIKEINIEF